MRYNFIDTHKANNGTASLKDRYRIIEAWIPAEEKHATTKDHLQAVFEMCCRKDSDKTMTMLLSLLDKLI